MTSEKIQKKFDLIIVKTFLRFLPKKVTPNILTIIRLILVPALYLLLARGYIAAGFTIFIIAALTDALDGALARTSGQVSDFGKYMDPIADKLLIGSVFLYIGIEYLIIKIFLFVIATEIAAVGLSALMYHTLGRPMGANTYGKIKMVLQTIAVITFIIGFITSTEEWIIVSEWILFTALFFALLSGLEQTRIKLKNIQ